MKRIDERYSIFVGWGLITLFALATSASLIFLGLNYYGPGQTPLDFLKVIFNLMALVIFGLVLGNKEQRELSHVILLIAGGGIAFAIDGSYVFGVLGFTAGLSLTVAYGLVDYRKPWAGIRDLLALFFIAAFSWPSESMIESVLLGAAFTLLSAFVPCIVFLTLNHDSTTQEAQNDERDTSSITPTN